MNDPLLSVIVPVYNEESCLPAFYSELAAALKALGMRHEIVFVDDGSTDASPGVLEGLQAGDPAVAVISLSRNFGHQTALTAGLELASGDVVVTLDSDLQHPPALIAQLVERWRGGAKVVHAIRRETEEIGWLKATASGAYYRLINALSATPIVVNAADFRLLDRQAVDLLKSMKEQHRFLRGMIGWLGLTEDSIEFVAPVRAAGRSKFTWRKMLHMATDGIVSFSIKPLRAALWLGVLSIALNAVYAVYILFMYFCHDGVIKGWPSLILLIMFLGSVQLFLLGIIGEYLGRTYEQSKGRPLYVVRRLSPGRGAALAAAKR
jgi:dolichol-phosphate mannosyltransferase